MKQSVLFAAVALIIIGVAPAPLKGVRNISGDDGQKLLSIDHYVGLKSTVPSIAGQPAHIYVRERVSAGVLARGAMGDKVAVFVHGAGTPAEVAFDVPTGDYSWMAYLANAGFDVFSMDTSGYGRSTRPSAMDDPCNLAADQQAQFVPALIAAPCKPSYPNQLTNIGSDWNDIGAVVDYVRALRHVDKVNMLAWSLGGPRAGGYAAQHPEKVLKLVLLAPAYTRAAEPAAPQLPRPGTTFNTQSRSEFIANWDRQVGCPAQYDPAVRDVVWSEMLASDPVGATWGTGVRRAPSTTTWGWNAAAAAKMMMPTLIFSGIHDKQVTPERVRPLYDDLGASQKVLVDLACSSHNAMWEKNHLLMFAASLDWLTRGAVGEAKQGVVKLGTRMIIAAVVLVLSLVVPLSPAQTTAGAVNAEDKDQLTPLMKACARGDLKVVNDLIAGGADVNQPHAQFRVTPIMFAAYFGHLEIVKVLIAKGASVVLKDSVNAEAVDWAEFDNHEDVAKLLKANGGRPNPFLTLGAVPFSLMDKAKGQ